MYRALLLDVDGVLLNSKGEVSAASIQVLRQAHRLGVRLVVATGRTYPSLQGKLGSVPLPPYDAITNGGALAWPGRSPRFGDHLNPQQTPLPHQKPLVVGSLETAVWQGVADALTAATLNVLVYQAAGAGLAIYVANEEGHPHFTSYLQRNQRAVVVQPNLSQTALPNVIQVASIGAGQGFVQASQRVREQFAGSTRNHTMALYIDQTFGQITEFFHPAVSKWAGFAALHPELARQHAAQVIAVGDEANDREMLSQAGMAVAMGNATPAIQQQANLVTASHDEEGLAKALQQLLGL